MQTTADSAESTVKCEVLKYSLSPCKACFGYEHFLKDDI